MPQVLTIHLTPSLGVQWIDFYDLLVPDGERTTTKEDSDRAAWFEGEPHKKSVHAAPKIWIRFWLPWPLRPPCRLLRSRTSTRRTAYS